MDAELRSLEDKVNQVVALAQRLRADNHDLRQQLATALNDNKQLTDKISIAATKLESLLAQIPDEPARGLLHLQGRQGPRREIVQ
jgi:uncharacterized protein (TIGR02449 family)